MPNFHACNYCRWSFLGDKMSSLHFTRCKNNKFNKTFKKSYETCNTRVLIIDNFVIFDNIGWYLTYKIYKILQHFLFGHKSHIAQEDLHALAC
jgi:hypothetical protein